MQEVWKDIPGYEGIYQASTLGRIKSVKKQKIMKYGIHRDGYYKIKLCKHGQKRWYQSHRLIAITFIDNPQNYKCVNHKDENKLNNCIDNLEWCTTAYNNSYGSRLKRVSENNKTKRKVIQYDINGNYIAEYKSLAEASKKTSINISCICESCKRKYKTPRKYVFRYREDVI